MSDEAHDPREDDDRQTRFGLDRRSVFKWAGVLAGAGAIDRLVPWGGSLIGQAAAEGTPFLDERGEPTLEERFDRPDQPGWGSRWVTDGVANRRIEDASGVLEAGTNIYPSHKRALAVLVDARVRDATIAARIPRGGVGPGVLLRRTAPATHYAALLEREEATLKLVAREHRTEQVLARAPLPGRADTAIDLSLTAQGQDPTRLTARVTGDPLDEVLELTAEDATAALQAPGDPGVLATSETGFRAGPDWRTPLGTQSARAAWVVDQATQAQASPVPLTEARRAATELTSTALFDRVALWTDDALATTPASAAAATTLDPVPGGARVGVVSDVPARVEIEAALDGSFDPPDLVVDAGQSNRFGGAFARIAELATDQPIHWRPRFTRPDGTVSYGPVRSFRALPAAGAGSPITLAIGSCATQFTTSFPAIEDEDPDLFVWQGDLNYIDASGPLAQTETGYAGMWTDVQNTPELAGILHDAFFLPQRDDHDYGLNDCWKETIPEHGKTAWDRVMHPEPYYRFGGGLVDGWVLDQRRWRDDPSLPDEAGKTLVGTQQFEWLKAGLEASQAPFKLVCSPDPLFNVPNASDSWATAYTAERDELLTHVDQTVSGRTIFVTGDTHSGAVTRVDDTLEVRAAPMDIPGPGQHDASSGDTVVYSEQGKFYCLVEIQDDAGTPRLDIALKHHDGSTAWSETFHEPRP